MIQSQAILGIEMVAISGIFRYNRLLNFDFY